MTPAEANSLHEQLIATCERAVSHGYLESNQ